MRVPSNAEVDKAFASDPQTRDAGRDEIIASYYVEGFQFCSDHAKRIGDVDSHEFWLVEIATARADADTTAEALAELAEEILFPQGRFFESLFYLEYIEKALFGELEDRIRQLRIQASESAASSTDLVPGDDWKTYDLSKPLERGKSQQHYYDRLRAYFFAVKEEKLDTLFADLQVDYLPRIFGYFIGLTSGLKELGVESETSIRSFRDFQSDFYPNFRPGLPRAKKSAPAVATGETVESKPAKSEPRSLGGYGMTKKK